MKHIRDLFRIFLFFISITIITGIIYPATSVLASQALFKKQANGSIQKFNGVAVGAKNLGEDFSSNQNSFFQGRESANNYQVSGGSNLSPNNKDEKERIEKRKTYLSKLYSVQTSALPIDSYTMSASGYDPDISVEYAKIQIPLISFNTKISQKSLKQLVLNLSHGKKVNVLLLNIGLLKLANKGI